VTAVNLRDGNGKSWYDALQLKLEKRFAHGLQTLVSYTYSRTDDNITPAGIHPSLANVRMPAASKALDIPNILVTSWTYELPFGPGQRFLSDSSGLAKRFVEGWTISGITNYHSGDPLNITVASSLLNTGSGNWSNVTCSSIGAPHTVAAWWDTSCFANPPQYQFGNYRIGDVRGPNVFNTDFSAAKKTRVGPSALELRVDTFNLFNRAHFATPTGASLQFGTATFGTINNTRLTPREVQLSVRMLF